MNADLCRRGGSLFAAILACATAPTALAGPDWEEGPTDAGSTIGTAQIINTTGSVNTITGRLNGTALLGGDFQDCFLLDISNPALFSLTTSPGIGGTPGFDPMMFLFRVDELNGQLVAKAVMANNDKAVGNPQAALQRETNDGSQSIVATAGLYLIAISGFGSQPINAQGQFIFNQEFLQPGIFGGPTQNQQVSDYLLAGWNTDGSSGSYVMTVTGVSGTQLPAPGAAALLALAGLATRRRQR
jgi:MYXO-CTERM domain-containing protein